MDLAEQYRALALKVEVSLQKHGPFAKPQVERIAAQRLDERLGLFETNTYL